MDSLFDPFRSASNPDGRRARRRRAERRSRSVRATIAAITAGAMLAIGLPTMAFAAAGGVDASDASSTASSQTPEQLAADASESEPSAGDGSGEGADARETGSDSAATPSEAPADEPTTEQPPAEPQSGDEPPAATETPDVEAPEASDPPSSEPKATSGTDPPADRQQQAAAIAPLAAFPADTADCTSNCSDLTMRIEVVGGSATADAWTLHAIRANAAQDNYDFDDDEERPVPRNSTYTLYADGGAAGYSLTGFDCDVSSQQGADPSFDADDRTVTFPNSNGRWADCTFTFTLVEPATIAVRVGGDRTGPASVSGLAGVQLELRADSAGTPGALIGQPWSTCTSNASGVCTFTVPTPDGSRYWVVQRVAPDDVPAGWFSNDTLAIGSTPGSQAYRFRTPAVGSGDDLASSADFMIASGNDNNQASGGIWQNSRVNPVAPQQCGIDVALVIDLSGSVAPYETQLKNAAKDFVDALTGTPSQIGIYTFNNVAPASAGSNLSMTPVSTAAGAETVKEHIDDFGTPTEATNWDRGISQVAASGIDYDLAVILTDGNPTVYSNDEGPGNRTRFREVENGVFSANAVKALGIRMVAVGVGDGIDGSPDNLVAISGPDAGSDYFQTENYEAAGETLRELALGDCEGSVSVVKQVVDEGTTGEQKTGAIPTAGWEFAVDSNDPEITPATQSGTTQDGTGAVNFPLEFDNASSAGSVTVTESQQSGYSLVTTGGKNAVCTEVESGDPVAVVNDGAVGFTIDVGPTVAVTCTVWNRPPEPQADVRIDKTWIVNGQTVTNGNQPAGLTAQLKLDGANKPFGVVQTGYTAGDEVAISETTGVGDRDLCRVTKSTVTLANGEVVDETLPFSPTLESGGNTFTLTNVVTCTAELTLVKSVANGDAQPADWTLDAVAPVGALAGPNGTSGATAPVTPAVRYPLTEDGDPRYVQTILPGGIPTPPATGSWNCVQVDEEGTTIPGFADGINGGVTVPLGFRVRCTAVNQTASLTLVKNVVNDLDIDADPADWTLVATPEAPAPAGLDPVEATSGDTVFVRPGQTYTISETGGPDGWEQTSIMCRTTPNGQFVETNEITVAALGQGTCVVHNDPIAPTLELTKIVTGDVAPADGWTLSASRSDDHQVVAQGPGGTGGPVTVPAGVAFELAETTDLADADQFAAGVWSCSLNDGPGVPGAAVPALGAGDEVSCTVTNTLKPITPSITKTAAVPVPNADGSWTVTYDVVVTNPSAFQPLGYILSDELHFGSDVTVNSASYQRVLPLPAGSSQPWTVAFDQIQPFDGEPALAAGTSHTWRVTVNATVDDGADFDGTTAPACDELEPGTVGFLNTATMYVGQTPYEASDCALPVKPTIAKTGGTAVDNGDGTWTLPYTITVTNPSATTSVVYDLVDELDLPAGAVPTGPATVVAQPVPTVASWTGFAPNTLLADDVTLPGTAGLDEHVYEVQVVVEIGADQAGFRCPGDGGLDNTATLESGNQTDGATGCVTLTPPTMAIDKQVAAGSVAQHSDGLWSIAYDLVVTNTGAAGGTYSLADALRFGAGVDLSAASYAITKDGSPFPSAWAGSGAIASDVYLAAGDPDPKHTYRITVTGIALDGPALTDAQALCPQDGANGGFNNLATLTAGGAILTDTACDAPSAPTVEKTGATAAQQPDASWNVSYTVTVDNSAPGAKPAHYSLADAPAYPGGVAFNTVSINGGPAQPYAGGAITLATDAPILGGDLAVYTLVFNVDAPAGAVTADDRQCTENGTPGRGFLNTATVTSGAITDSDWDCTPVREGGRPTIAKSDPTVTQAGDGTWTAVYEITVTGNPDYVSTYTLDDTLHVGGAIDIESATWSGGGDDGTWGADPQTGDTATIVGPTPKPIAEGATHTYTVTVTAKADEAAFADPTTTTCAPTEESPNVGFLNRATLTSGGVPQSDDGCAVPARPVIAKTPIGSEAVKSGDHWEVSYELTVTNSSATQGLVYDLADTPDLAGGVTITDRSVESTDVTVDPDWNGADPATDVIALDQALAGGAMHTYTVTVSFTVDADAEGPALRCGGDDGQGLLNRAVVTSGGEWSDDGCVDVPVVVIVDKTWVIDGGDPIAWDGDDLPAGFGAQGRLDGSDVDWGAESGPYAIGDEVAIGETDVVVPIGCEIVDAVSNGTGEHRLDASVSTFLVTNEVECVQTVNLEKHVMNAHGGDAVASDWTVSATGPDDGFGGPATASGAVDLDVAYTLGEVSPAWEDGVDYEVSATWSCSSEQGDDAFTLVSDDGAATAQLTVDELGATVDCVIENTDIAPTLTLVKDVAPDSVEAEFPPTLWTVSATEEGESAIVAGAGTATGEVEANVDYVLGELASDFDGVDEFDAGAWSCDAPGVLDDDTVNLEPGDDVTCTIVNTAQPAEYSLDKQVIGVEQLDDGTWSIEYRVTVFNESHVSAVTYDLVDSLAGFGDGIDIDEAVWTGPDGAEGEWEDPAGEPVEELANDVVLPASAGSHEYVVTVQATVAADAVWDDPATEEVEGSTSCVPGEQGGFANTAVLTVAGVPSGADACDEPGRTTATKVAHPATSLGLGDWEVTYDITVGTVGDHDLVYDLDDALAFPDGVTIESATAEDPDGDEVAGWNGQDATTLATAQPITAGDTHVWTVTVRANVASITSIDLATCEASETGGGFLNTAELRNGMLVTELEGCTEIPVGKLKLSKTVDNSALLDLGIDPSELLVAADWNLSGDSGSLLAQFLNGGGVELVVPTGSYLLAEQLAATHAGNPFAAYYHPEAWLCGDAAVTHALVATGGTTACTLNNVADSLDVGIGKDVLLPEGTTAVQAGDAFEYSLTVTNHGTLDAQGLEVGDVLPDDLIVTGAATFEAADSPAQPGTWAQTSGVTENAFAATYTGTYPAGAVTTITIPVQVAVPAPLPPVPPVGPDDPAPELPTVDLGDIHNEACVAIVAGQEPELARVMPVAEDGVIPDMVPENDCDDVDVPTKAIDSAAYTRCVNDVPYLYYDVAISDDVEPGPITVTWTPEPSVYPDAEPIVTEIPWSERAGRLLWPYGVVDDDGISIGWPGWRLVEEGDVVGENGIVAAWENMVKDSKLESYAFADQVNPMTITFSVNPSESILAVYPQATPACEVVRDPSVEIVKTASVDEVKPGGAFDYTLSVTNSGLGAIENMELFDEIPSDLKVTAITTDEAPAFPRWDDCAVNDADADGYGGTLHCVLTGMIGGTEPDAPDVVLSVVLDPESSVGRVDNTGEVCWNDPDDAPVEPEAEDDATGGDGVAPTSAVDPELPVLCDDSTVTVTVVTDPSPTPNPTPGIASTGFAGSPFLWGAAGLLLTGALLVAVTIVRRRRPGERRTE
ncbi:hypothetical protein [Agromyces sp. NPDC055658]